jgi:hypothetical protein
MPDQPGSGDTPTGTPKRPAKTGTPAKPTGTVSALKSAAKAGTEGAAGTSKIGKAAGGGVQGAALGAAANLATSTEGRTLLIRLWLLLALPGIAFWACIIVACLTIAGALGGTTPGSVAAAQQDQHANDIAFTQKLPQADLSAYQDSSSDGEAPWVIYAAIAYEQSLATSHGTPGYDGPLAITDTAAQKMPGYTARTKTTAAWNTTSLVPLLDAALDRAALPAGVIPSINVGIETDGNGGYAVAAAGTEDAQAHDAVRALYVTALATLPIQNAADPAFTGSVFDTALDWYMGNKSTIATCVGGTVTTPVTTTTPSGSAPVSSAAPSNHPSAVGGLASPTAAPTGSGAPITAGPGGTAPASLVGGGNTITGKQVQIAIDIVRIAQAMTPPANPVVTVSALAAAQVESGFHDWASLSDPPSLTAPQSDGPPATNGGYGDHGSLGVFQQQTQEPTMHNPIPGQASTANWGTWQQLMDVSTAASLYLTKAAAIQAVSATADPAVLAQAVQVSGPDAYAAAVPAATAYYDQITGSSWTSNITGGGVTGTNVCGNPVQTCTAAGVCTISGGNPPVVNGTAGQLITWSLRGDGLPYDNCRPGCADITGVHSCAKDYTTACQLSPEDCSGFQRWVFFNALGIDIGTWTGAEITEATTNKWIAFTTASITADVAKLKPGDLIVYGTDYSAASSGHVVMYMGGGKINEASTFGQLSAVNNLYDSANAGENFVTVIRLPGLTYRSITPP